MDSFLACFGERRSLESVDLSLEVDTEHGGADLFIRIVTTDDGPYYFMLDGLYMEHIRGVGDLHGKRVHMLGYDCAEDDTAGSGSGALPSSSCGRWDRAREEPVIPTCFGIGSVKIDFERIDGCRYRTTVKCGLYKHPEHGEGETQLAEMAAVIVDDIHEK